MREMRVFWCDDVPEEADIEFAFLLAEHGQPVMIKWRYHTSHSTYMNVDEIITTATTAEMTASEFYKKYVPAQPPLISLT